MYDTSFDRETAELPKNDRRALWCLRAIALLLTFLAASADAQLPGMPVLQNAWSTPGVMIGIDGGGTSNRTSYAAAASWSPVPRFSIVGGAGFQTGTAVGSGAAYGVRVAIPFAPAASQFGAAFFAGVGGTASHRNPSLLSEFDSVTNSSEIPVGASFAWRHLGATRGYSAYVAPAIVYYAGGTSPDNLFRVAFGLDMGLTDSWGVTAGADVGQSRPRGVGGPGGPQFAIGVSRVLIRR